MVERGKFGTLFDAFKAGQITRRQFSERALALGVGAPVVAMVARAVPAAGAPAPRRNAGWAFQAEGTAPAVGTEGKTRGQDGELKILQWQAATQITPHLLTGTKDYLATALVFEPLMNYLPDGSLVPTLVQEVPSIENGLLAQDLRSVTFNLREGVTWSDGTPFTAADVVFTRDWVMDPANAAVDIDTFRPIASIEATDDLTVTVTYAEPNATWYVPFSGTVYGFVIPKHVLEGLTGSEAAQALTDNPVGTGPYVIESFAPGDQIIYQANPNFRDPNKPYFATVNLKGGGDAASAAQAVLQTGDYDYAWNMQVEPAILRQLEESGGRGKIVVARGNSLERININFSDPNTEVNGQRSEKNTPHPYLSDLAVRQAMNLAADRTTMANEFYFGEEGEPATANVLTGMPNFESPNTAFEYNTEEANRILDEAGWTLDGDVRAKDGVELRLTYATSINAVRQKNQAVFKAGLEEIGFRVQLQQVDAAIFFDGSPGNEQNINHFYTDVNMYTNNPSTPTPTEYMLGWYAGPDGANIAQAENQWNGQNNIRYNNPEYDALLDAVRLETDLERAAEIFIQMNDILINDVAVIPLVNRAADKYVTANTLVDENVALSPFEINYWNIANWNRVAE